MTQNKEWLFQQLRAAGLPEGTGLYEDYEKCRLHLAGEAVGRRDQRVWDSPQGAVREYCGMEG